jgi:DinB superfamily
VIGECMLRIVRQDQPSWRRLSPRTYIRRTDYPDWDFAPALQAFTEQRRELLSVLTPLPPEVWDRTAAVKISPTEVRARSLLFHGEWLARHEAEHLPQIAALAGR